MAKSHFELLGDLARKARDVPPDQAQELLELAQALYEAWQADMSRVLSTA